MTHLNESDRIRAHGRLMVAVSTAADEGQPVPCHAGLLWTAEYEDEEDRAYANQSAARQCRACHLFEDCRRYVVAFPEPAGIWAGMTPVQQAKAHREEAR